MGRGTSEGLEAVLAETGPVDVGGLPMDDLRQVRNRLKAVEDGLSYLRRLVQGRLDVVAAEQARRSDGAEANLEEMIARLPSLLAGSTRSAGAGRPPQRLDPGAVDAELAAELHDIISHAHLLDVSSLTDEDLWAVEAELGDLERAVSGYRRQVFDRLDAIEAEVTRRYRTGEQSVDDLLR